MQNMHEVMRDLCGVGRFCGDAMTAGLAQAARPIRRWVPLGSSGSFALQTGQSRQGLPALQETIVICAAGKRQRWSQSSRSNRIGNVLPA